MMKRLITFIMADQYFCGVDMGIMSAVQIKVQGVF